MLSRLARVLGKEKLKNKPRTTELRPAFVWTCEACGTDHFEYCIVAELSEEEKEGLLRDSEWTYREIENEWGLKPDTVKCPHCGREYETINFNMGT